MNFLNLTPHTLNVHTTEGQVVNLPPSGKVARVATQDEPGYPVGGIPTVRTTFGEVTDLPPTDGETIFVVSGMVAQVAPRLDVMSPGPLVRDDAGRPTGCLGLRRSI